MVSSVASSASDSFADHSDHLRRLRAQLVMRQPPTRSVSGESSTIGSQPDLPVSPAPQSIPPRRRPHGTRVGGTALPEPQPQPTAAVTAQWKQDTRTQLRLESPQTKVRATPPMPPQQHQAPPDSDAHDTQTHTARAAHSTRTANAAELREASAIIEGLQHQVGECTRALEDAERRASEACDAAAALRQEAESARAELQEAEEGARKALQLREEHHEREKADMLQVYQQLQADLSKMQSDSQAARLSQSVASRQLADAEAAQAALQSAYGSTHEELQQRRRQQADGAELHSLVRRLEDSEGRIRQLLQELAVEQGHSEELTQRLRDLTVAHQATLDELRLLQEEHSHAAESHRGTIAALQETHRCGLDEAQQDKERMRHLSAQLRRSEATELQLKCRVTELQEELAFQEAAHGDHRHSTELLQGEIVSLKEIIASMEGGWDELSRVREELRAATAEIEEARRTVDGALASEAETQRRLSALATEHAEAIGRAGRSETYAQELEVVIAESASAADELAACFPHLRGAALPRLAAACHEAVQEKEALVQDLRSLRQEHLDITRLLDGVHERIDSDKRKAEEAERRSDRDRAAYEALREEVDNTQRQIQRHEASVVELEAVADADRSGRDAALQERDTAVEQVRQLQQRVVDLQVDVEERVRSAEASGRALLAKVQGLREEERRAHSLALSDMHATAERNRRQRQLVDSLEGQLRVIRAAAAEALQGMASGGANADSLAQLVEELKASNARFRGAHEADLVGLQKQVGRLTVECNGLRAQADQAREEAKKASLQLQRSQRDVADNASAQALLLTYQSSQEEVHRDLDALLVQKRASEEELARASQQVQELRQHLQQAREARLHTEEENSTLTTQLCRTRQEAQQQQRLLLSEIDTLMRSASGV